MIKSKNSPKTKTCKLHGEYVALAQITKNKTIPLNCPDCIKLQIANIDKKCREDNLALRSSCDKQRISNTSGVGVRLQNTAFADYRTDVHDVQIKIKESFENLFHKITKNEEADNHLIIGNVGTGKTFISSILVNELNRYYQNPVAKIAKMTDIISDIKSTNNYILSDESKSDAINRYVTCKLLVIDEIDLHVYSEHDQVLLYSIIDGRYQNKLPTVILSNAHKETIKQILGERELDRLNLKAFSCAFESLRNNH